MGKSLDLDGATQNAEKIDNGASIYGDPIGTSNFAHWAWLNSRATSTAEQLVAGYFVRTGFSTTMRFNIWIVLSTDPTNPNKIRLEGITSAGGTVNIFSPSAIAGDNTWHLPMLIGLTTSYRGYLDGVFIGGGAANYNYNTGGSHRYMVGSRKSDAGESEFMDGFVTHNRLAIGSIADADAYALARWQDGIPETGAIPSVTHGYPYDNIVSLPTIPDDVGSADLTGFNITAGDIATEFPPGVGRQDILPKIIDPVLPVVINPVF